MMLEFKRDTLYEMYSSLRITQTFPHILILPEYYGAFNKSSFLATFDCTTQTSGRVTELQFSARGQKNITFTS